MKCFINWDVLLRYSLTLNTYLLNTYCKSDRPRLRFQGTVSALEHRGKGTVVRPPEAARDSVHSNPVSVTQQYYDFGKMPSFLPCRFHTLEIGLIALSRVVVRIMQVNLNKAL